MSLVVLSDEVIRTLLENLTREEVESIAETLKSALHEYSTGTQNIDETAYQQPARTSAYSDRIGATTLFTPSSSPLGHGVKMTTTSSSQTSPSTGSLTLHSPSGHPLAILPARNLTAFRVALSSSCLLQKRARVRTLTVFGAGLQAYWHIRLALLLRGPTIRVVHIINRRFSTNAREILRAFYAMPTDIRAREGWAETQFSLLTPGYGDFERVLKDDVRAADVIYCCTPSREALFDAGILISHEGRRKGRLIVAVGSQGPDMRELPAELLGRVTRMGGMHWHRHAVEGGVVVVDSLRGALEVGEVVDAGLEARQLVELGELVMIRRLAAAEEEEEESSSQDSISTDSLSKSLDSLNITPQSSSSSGSGFHMPHFRRRRATTTSSHSTDEKDDHLSRWMTSGNVIYKSVGLGLMDLVVGLEIVRLAEEKGVGVRVEEFCS